LLTVGPIRIMASNVREVHPDFSGRGTTAMKPEEFVAFLGSERASAILRTDDGDLAVPAMEAALAAGFRVCEYTLTIPGAFECIRETSSRHGNVVVGAGTVLTEDQARKAIDHGARFLVSPIMDPKMIQLACDLDVAIIPGCSTPTEMQAAHEAGAPLVKLFPGPAGGPSWVKAAGQTFSRSSGRSFLGQGDSGPLTPPAYRTYQWSHPGKCPQFPGSGSPCRRFCRSAL